MSGTRVSTSDPFRGNDPADRRELAVELLVTSARFTRLAARETPTGMPRALWRALAQLEDLGPTRVSDLAAADRVSQPTATTLVQKLVEHGWALRCTDSQDRRAVQVTITDAGRAALAEARDAAAEALQPRLDRLDPESLRALAAGVEALHQVLEADGPDGPARDGA
jgi:DNA-binding MarR family transcriptional regulator